jgi:hypothetical protein
MAEYPEKKKYPERQFTAESAMQNYFSTLQDEENDKRAMNIVHNLYLLSPGYAGSSEASYNANQISKGSSTGSAGLSTRYRIMGDADKERVAKEFTTRFQVEDFPDMETFYKWTKTMGPWYSETLLRQHEAITKNRVDALKSTKVGEAVDTLFGEYNDEWVTGDYAEQNQVRQNIADSDAIKNLPSKWRASAVDEVIKMLNSFLSPTGQYAEEIEARRVTGEERAVTAEEAAERERMQKTMDISSDDLASRIAMKAYDYMQDDNMEREAALEKAIDEDRALARGDTVAPYARKGYVAARAKLENLIKTPAKLQTETYWDDDLQDYVLATDQEAREQGLDPEKVGARKQPRLMDRRNAEERFWLEAGHALMEDGDLSRDIFEFYRQHARMIDSPREYDMEIMRLWRKKKKELEDAARASSQPSINFQMLNPDVTGQATGQTDGFLSNPRLKKPGG